MDLNTDSEMLSSHAAFEEPALEQESSGSHSPTGSGGTIMLQLLEFKTHLHEVIEELQIRRDGEKRFEDQISELVLEKQELEWEKESLQHQIETMTNQHSESLTAVKKQFQVKLQHTEEEKGKYQVCAELKDKEINNLKEELKSLQLLKFNLENKSSELERKLALQNRTKDTYLSQLGEVEKRYAALSRQYAVVREAHGNREQNVEEAMKRNAKLSSANKRQEEMIVALKNELDEVSNKLIKEKMKVVINEKTHSSSGREQHLQVLQQKLKMESDVNKKLQEENDAERFEKKELMRSLQQNQQLLLNQTQTVRRLEQELQSQRQMFQALKEEQEVMREKSKTTEDEVVQLTESYAASRTSWDKEKAKLLDQLKSEEEQLRAATDACRDLQEKLVELSVRAGSELRLADKQRIKDTQSVSNVRSSLMVEDIRCKETLNTHISSSEPPDLDSLQDSDSPQTKSSEPLEDTGEGQYLSNHQQQPQANKHTRNDPNTSTCGNNNLSSFPDNTQAEPEMKILETNSEMSELIVSDGGHKAASNPECASPAGCADLPTRNTDEEWNRGRDEQRTGDKRQQENIRELQETDAEQEEKQDAKDGRHPQEKCTLTAQTSDGVDVLQDTEGSAKAAGETGNTETEIRDKGEGEVTDGVKEKEQTAESTTETPETQIPALTTADTAEKSLTLQVNDFTDTGPPLNAENLCQKITENHSNKYKIDRKDICKSGDVQSNFTDEVLTLCQDSEPPNDQSEPTTQNQKHENQSSETAGVFPSGCFENLLQAAPQENKIQESETNETHIDDPLHIDPNMKETDENDTFESLKGVADEANTATGSTQEHMKSDGDVAEKKADLKQLASHKIVESSEAGSLKCLQQPLIQMKSGSSVSTLSSKKTSTSVFEWGTAQRKPFSSRANSDFSILHKLIQGTPVSESGPSTLGQPLSLTSPPVKIKHNKVPVGITSVSGAAAYLRNQQQEEKLKEACRETAANTDRRRPLFISSFPVSCTGSQVSHQTSSEAPSPAAGSGSESDLGPSFSQESEDKESLFRARISKIEQFLKAERLRLLKRPWTDN
ncbi:coiled-coil domain-containing protein 73 [Austrofundulus limnaeus]|uniref:Coiled-coil domain-containing protein 73 n=1 Tax=Austrofundulus limnaeus TaxID=52670 RepID=A0A2I4BIQ5_AUSLI|nr:PREDICTED: coiled-coil domain-containing protein 73 [Austrofundulus limnaeus]